MSKHANLRRKFLSKPSDFTWNELVTLLKGFGYKLASSGKTGGSRVRFLHLEKGVISLHKPHPSLILKRYQIRQIIEILKNEGLI